jgi:hypothetical protein
MKGAFGNEGALPLFRGTNLEAMKPGGSGKAQQAPKNS